MVATDGQNITIPFNFSHLERADQVKVHFEGINKTKLVGELCFKNDSCDYMEPDGVFLKVEGERLSLILLEINSSRQGNYTVIVLIGEKTDKRSFTLLVKTPFSSSTIPPHSPTSESPTSSNYLWLYFLLLLLLLPLLIYGIWLLLKQRKTQACSQIHAGNGHVSFHSCDGSSEEQTWKTAKQRTCPVRNENLPSSWYLRDLHTFFTGHWFKYSFIFLGFTPFIQQNHSSTCFTQRQLPAATQCWETNTLILLIY